MAVVVINEDAKDLLEMLWVQDQESVKTLRANGPGEPLRHSVRLRGTKRRANNVYAMASKHFVKTAGEFLIPSHEVNGFTLMGAWDPPDRTARSAP
jgi:hypothetical protein